MNYPKATKKPTVLTKHNHERVDNYYWLNDRENEEVIEYLHAENAYTKKQLVPTEPLQKELYDEIVAKIVKDDSSVPYESNGYWYYARYEEGKDYPIYCRKRGHGKGSLDADEEILLDVNVLAKGHAYYSVGGLSVSPDNRMLCYGVDNVSRRIYTLYFKNLETGEVLEERIESTTGSATWAADNTTIFFTQMEKETLRDYKVFRYRLGSNEAVEVYHEVDDTYGVHVSKSKSKKYIFIESYSTLSTEVQTLLADDPLGEFKVFATRERELEYSVEDHEEKFVIATNLEAKNFRLMECDLVHTSKENWKERVAHRDDVLLEGFELFNDFLVLEEKKNGLTHIRVMNTKTEESYYLDFGEEVYDAYISMNLDFDTNVLVYGYNSLTTPNSTISFDMISREKTVLKETQILGEFNKEDYESKRAWVTAKDGKQIPLSLVYKKGIALDGTNPTLQYAYGSYGISIDASFSISRLSLLDRGFVFAIAHIRGGEELGREWYEDGKLLTKMNTFTDFIVCSEYLIKEGYTSKEKLFAQGGSAGGMLMGGIINMKSELYKGVVAQVPFVDVVTTMLDDTIPLTTGEYDEWGNPNEKVFYDYMLGYSPYDNVAKQEYPNLLVTTGLHDSQVQYWEPAKWVAKLREHKTDENMLLLHINMDTGHGGASGRFEAFKEVAMVYAFLLKLRVEGTDV